MSLYSLIMFCLFVVTVLSGWVYCFVTFHKIKKFIFSYDLESAWKLWDKKELKEIKEFTGVIKNEKR